MSIKWQTKKYIRHKFFFFWYWRVASRRKSKRLRKEKLSGWHLLRSQGCSFYFLCLPVSMTTAALTGRAYGAPLPAGGNNVWTSTLWSRANKKRQERKRERGRKKKSCYVLTPQGAQPPPDQLWKDRDGVEGSVCLAALEEPGWTQVNKHIIPALASKRIDPSPW